MLRNKLMCSIVCSNAYTRAVAPHYKNTNEELFFE